MSPQRAWAPAGPSKKLPNALRTSDSRVAHELEHGLVDALIPRLEMKKRLSDYLDFLLDGRKQSLAALG